MSKVDIISKHFQDRINRELQEFFIGQTIVDFQTTPIGEDVPLNSLMSEGMNKGIIKTYISERDKGFYTIRKESWCVDGDEASRCKVETCYTKDENKAYIGDKKMAYYLTKKIGITKFEKAHSSHSVCSIGFNEKDQKWAGWSHRCLCTFGIGDKIFDAKYGNDKTLFVKHGKETIKTLADAKVAAKRFASYIS